LARTNYKPRQKNTFPQAESSHGQLKSKAQEMGQKKAAIAADASTTRFETVSVKQPVLNWMTRSSNQAASVQVVFGCRGWSRLQVISMGICANSGDSQPPKL
jgi:hypothetical protein